MDGQLDALVLTAGTGGTLSPGSPGACARRSPAARSSASTPRVRSWPAPAEIKPYKVEGIGYDFIPDVLDRGLVDEWLKSNDHDSFLTARKLIRQEGLLVGGSSGSAVWAALQVARGTSARPASAC